MGYVISIRTESGGVPDPHANDSVLPKLESVTAREGCYHISLAFTNVTYAENLENIIINPRSSKPVTGLIAYLNGTALPEGAPVEHKFRSGDSLQVDLTLPQTEFDSGETIELCVMGDCFMSGQTVKLP